MGKLSTNLENSLHLKFLSVHLRLTSLYILIALNLYFDNINALQRQVNFYETRNNRLKVTFKQVRAASRLSCCGQCSLVNECSSVNYKRTTNECELSTVALKNVTSNSDSSSEWTTFSKDSPDWTLVFQGIADIGTDLYSSWLNGANVTSHDVNCMGTDVTSCSRHYRSNLVDSWSSLGIREVKLSLYHAGGEAAYITFDATDTDLESWFDPRRVLSSSWSTSFYNTLFNYFSIPGHAQYRRFYINLSFGGCGKDPTLLVVVQSYRLGCSYENHTSYPKIIYSTTDTWMTPASGLGYAFADSLTISIK